MDAQIGADLTREELELQQHARTVYERRLAAGVAREQARKDLPLSTYTEAYWKLDLHNLFHFLALRMDPHAQQEIRAYADVIGNEVVKRWCPITWEAFTDYRFGGLELSRTEADIIRLLASHQSDKAIKHMQHLGLIALPNKPPIKSRERDEIEAKLEDLGLPIPWQLPPSE